VTAATTSFSLDVLDAALAAAVSGLGEDEQRLAAAVLRLLAAGAPVSIPAAVASAGLPSPRAEQALQSWPAVFWDGHGQVTGFWAWPWPVRRTASATPGPICMPGARGTRCSSPGSSATWK
jgi:hypothetical protein